MLDIVMVGNYNMYIKCIVIDNQSSSETLPAKSLRSVQYNVNRKERD